MDSSASLETHHDPHHHSGDHDHHELGFWRKYIFYTDHFVIGRKDVFPPEPELVVIVVAGMVVWIVMGFERSGGIHWKITYLLSKGIRSLQRPKNGRSRRSMGTNVHRESVLVRSRVNLTCSGSAPAVVVPAGSSVLVVTRTSGRNKRSRHAKRVRSPTLK